MKNWLPVIGAILVLVVSGAVIYSARKNGGQLVLHPTPSPSAAVQLSVDQQPKIKMTFTADAHYTTVDIENLHADKVEYNLIYDATVGKSALNTGVNSTAVVTGKSSFSQKQLLGSESSGHFSYHENIHNATMDLTLRDSAGRSIFTATYPFTVTPGGAVSLTASE